MKLYDAKCYALAHAFLYDVKNLRPERREALIKELAEDIQDTVEDFLKAVPEANVP
jgi:hypothetical protein